MTRPGLERYLENHYRRFDYKSHIHTDPCRFLRPYIGGDTRELEIVGILAASLAYGRVTSITSSVARSLAPFDGSPMRYLQGATVRQLKLDYAGFRHRWTSSDDVIYLILSMQELYSRHDTMEDLVVRRDESEADVADGLERLVNTLLTPDLRRFRPSSSGPTPRSLKFLLSRPSGGSTCKRLLMFARWMTRSPQAPDGVDLGIWTRVRSRDLLLPLDTHTARLTGYLGLAGQRKSVDLRRSRQVTAALARFDPEDPVKYDFALAHLGISGGCRHSFDPEICPTCPLEPVCLLA